MVGTPIRRHRRTAAIRAQQAIAAVSPLRERDKRAERRRIIRGRRLRNRAALLRGMREVLGLPPLRRNRRPLPAPRVDPAAPIVLSSDEEQPPPQHPLVDLDSSLESLPNIDPRPQFQLPVQPLPDLGPLNITLDFIPPLQHQTLREACVVLQRPQLSPLVPITPPPEFAPQLPTPPLPREWWEGIETAVALFDTPHQYFMFPPLSLQRPDVVVQPEFVPQCFVEPRPFAPIDWAMIAHAVFAAAEQQAARPN